MVCLPIPGSANSTNYIRTAIGGSGMSSNGVFVRRAHWQFGHGAVPFLLSSIRYNSHACDSPTMLTAQA